ncbi:MAG: LCP family protein [Actinomycetes bacterium]
MPPPEKWSWQTSDSASRSPGASGARRARSPGFRRTVLFTILGTLLPGAGLIAARRRWAGGIILGLFVSALLVLGIWALVDLQGLASAAVRPQVLRVLAVVLLAAALVWVVVIVVSHLALRSRPTRAQRVGGGFLVGALVFAVAAPMAVAARYSYEQANLVNVVFKSEKETRSATRPTLKPAVDPTRRGDAPDPWADKPRLNVLLLGGDAGRTRTGTRTDTVILASIDTHTGDTTLFSLPRNTARMPFPRDSKLDDYYPNGYTNGDGSNAEFFLNAMYDNVPASVPDDVLGGTDNLGADVLKLSVGEALGLEVDYYVLVNLRGFERLVDALGGITVNINTYIPIGGSTDAGVPPSDYLDPGPNQKLDGREALWFARGRYGSDDFARMDRQRCVINAIIEQANPANLLARYEKIAKAGKEIVFTDIPQEVLPLMVDLSLRVKDGNVRSVVFKNGEAGFVSANPNFNRMRQRVKVALGEAQEPEPSTKPSKKPRQSPGPAAEPSAASEDVEDSCAYDPEVAATAQPPR